MTVEGVDYAWARPTPASLKAAGKVFACRYGGPGSAGKQLDPAEALALEREGVSVVANAEGAADGLLGGRAAGRDWATRALRHFTGCGMPANRPIYLSVDFDCKATNWPTVANALRGAGEILGPSMVGVYGSYDVMVWAHRDRVAAWFWETYAWSEGRWFSGNHIEQYRNGVSLGGGNVDLDRAHPADYGQWTPGGEVDMPLTTEDLVKIWTHDLHNGPGVDEAYQVLNRAAADAAAALAGVAELKARPPVQSAPVDPAALKAVLLDPAVLAAIAEAVADEEHRRSAA